MISRGPATPHVCYNNARHEYLIAYGGYTSSGGLHDELRLQRVNAVTGALIGASSRVTNLPGAFGSNVAYSRTSNSYLLVWDSGYDSPCPLYATRLDSTAVPVGSIFYATTGPYVWGGGPAICYNSVNDEFLVTFQAYHEIDYLTWLGLLRSAGQSLGRQPARIEHHHCRPRHSLTKAPTSLTTVI